MTLFLLLVTVAAVSPAASVVAEAAKLSGSGIATGALTAAATGLGQFIGHHRIVERLQKRLTATSGDATPRTAVVAGYYVLIVAGGAVSTLITLATARAFS